jgi:hypothetical protein
MSLLPQSLRRRLLMKLGLFGALVTLLPWRHRPCQRRRGAPPPTGWFGHC